MYHLSKREKKKGEGRERETNEVSASPKLRPPLVHPSDDLLREREPSIISRVSNPFGELTEATEVGTERQQGGGEGKCRPGRTEEMKERWEVQACELGLAKRERERERRSVSSGRVALGA